MRAFLIVGNRALTMPFNLNNLTAGRMDVLCRCIAQSLFISHGIRRDVEVYLLLLGEPEPPKAIRVVGSEVKNMAPDERNIAGLLRKALMLGADEWKRSSPGIYIGRKNIKDLLVELSEKYEVVYLREDGENIRDAVKELNNPLFVLGDHLGLSREIERVVLDCAMKIISVSPLSLQADQCIVIVHYELDRIDFRSMLNEAV
jgi:tRNA (pseudouridine54-N1)-methyltransferase